MVHLVLFFTKVIFLFLVKFVDVLRSEVNTVGRYIFFVSETPLLIIASEG